MSNIGLFGGTFDPVHRGHLELIRHVQQEYALDQIWFIPTFIPPHKENIPFATCEHRLAMLKIVIRDHSDWQICDLEIERTGISYSIDTVRTLQMRENNSAHQWFFIIGADNLCILESWKEYRELLQRVTFIAVPRPGFDLRNVSQIILDKVIVANTPMWPVSSSEIRDSKGMLNSVWLPDKVAAYIKTHHLYE